MHRNQRNIWTLISPILAAALCFVLPRVAHPQAPAANSGSSRYEMREKHDPEGSGKFYLGREIAHVMGHQAADWLERPERAEEEAPDLLLPALKLRAGEAVADI